MATKILSQDKFVVFGENDKIDIDCLTEKGPG